MPFSACAIGAASTRPAKSPAVAIVIVNQNDVRTTTTRSSSVLASK